MSRVLLPTCWTIRVMDSFFAIRLHDGQRNPLALVIDPHQYKLAGFGFDGQYSDWLISIRCTPGAIKIEERMVLSGFMNE